MKIKSASYKKLKLFGCYLIYPKLFKDTRGSFQEIYNQKYLYEITGKKYTFKQDNISISNKNVLRGLHFQIKKPQGKLIRVISGSIYDVFVDLRKSSPTFKKYQSINLKASENINLWLPPGIAHGFFTISKKVILNYKVTQFYDPNDEYTLKWNDQDLNIKWPTKKVILSKKDKYNCLTFSNVLNIIK